MRKRLKNHAEVAHYWANRIQGEGNSGSLFFNGDTIYSYGYHFPIARWANEDTILFTNRSYSVTTSGHCSLVWRAIPYGIKIVECEDPSVRSISGHIDNLGKIKDDMDKKLVGIKNAWKHKKGYRLSYNRLLANFKKYVDLFRIKSKLPAKLRRVYDSNEYEPDEAYLKWEREFDEKEAERARKRDERYAKIIGKSEEEQETKRREAIEYVKRWKQDTTLPLRYDRYYCSSIALRIKDDKIQTSMGAEITVEQGKNLWKYIKRSQHNQIRYDMKLKVNGYTTNYIDCGNLSIGCHYIKYVELLDIATQLGLEDREVYEDYVNLDKEEVS